MTSEIYFTVTSRFPGNVHVKPFSKHSAPPPLFFHSYFFVYIWCGHEVRTRGINVHKSIKSRPLNFLCRRCGGQELLSRSFISFRRHASCLLLRRLWQYQMWSFQGRDTKLKWFLAKNEIIEFFELM